MPDKRAGVAGIGGLKSILTGPAAAAFPRRGNSAAAITTVARQAIANRLLLCFLALLLSKPAQVC